MPDISKSQSNDKLSGLRKGASLSSGSLFSRLSGLADAGLCGLGNGRTVAPQLMPKFYAEPVEEHHEHDDFKRPLLDVVNDPVWIEASPSRHTISSVRLKKIG